MITVIASASIFQKFITMGYFVIAKFTPIFKQRMPFILIITPGINRHKK
jgi:hypothetical protein